MWRFKKLCSDHDFRSAARKVASLTEAGKLRAEQKGAPHRAHQDREALKRYYEGGTRVWEREGEAERKRERERGIQTRYTLIHDDAAENERRERTGSIILEEKIFASARDISPLVGRRLNWIRERRSASKKSNAAIVRFAGAGSAIRRYRDKNSNNSSK